MDTSTQQAQTDMAELRKGLKELFVSQKETDRQMKTLSAETDRKFKETAEQLQKTDRQLQETAEQLQKTDRQLRKTDRLFNSQWGKLVESLVEGDLVKLLKEKGVAVKRTLKNMKREHGERQFEFDIIAINGPEIVVVEVKTTLTVRDVDYFMKKLQNFTDFAPEYQGKKIYGAVAYIKADQSSHINAERRGLFVIRAVGSSSSIINKEDFKPKAFS